MADEENANASTWPNPPPFWRDFTPSNIARIDELRSAHNDTFGELPPRIPGVPAELCNLQPPAEPEDGNWRLFGEQRSLEAKLIPLEDYSITNLPLTHPTRQQQQSQQATSSPSTTATAAAAAAPETHYNHALELKRLTKSLLLNFLELTSLLSINPTHGVEKVQDLRTLLINIHHALNEYRPHQARESAAEMMHDHLDRTRRETVAVRSQVDKARRVLEGLGSLTVPEREDGGLFAEKDGEADRVRAREEKAREREKEIWAAADALLAG